jgi:oligopeptide transport system ATP-binding protein
VSTEARYSTIEESSETRDRLLQVVDLKKFFPLRKRGLRGEREFVRAVDRISFHLSKRETLGLVGESGCGKTTAGRSILRLIDPTSGEVYLDGSPNLATLPPDKILPYRRRMQMIFQDPFSSLNPRLTVGRTIAEALTIHKLARGRQKWERVAALLESVGLSADSMSRFPHEFSGGQRQRIGIARALAVEPEMIIADEPVSALDVSIRAQIINLLHDLQQRFGLSFLFISHDLSVVGHISHRVAVMYLGRIVELGTKIDVFENPLHPYTQALLLAVPKPDPRGRGKHIILEGDVPSPVHPPSGCYFHPRCPKRFADCDHIDPQLAESRSGHYAACLLYKTSYPKSDNAAT